jgi:hypothetical protein
MRRNIVFIGVVLGLLPALVQAQKAPAPTKAANKLVTGKIIYVAPMPGQLDQWIIQDMRAWGKYQVSGNSEGVDLVLEAQVPPKNPQYTQSERMPIRHHTNQEPRVLSLAVVNWVTGQRLWEAKVLNRRAKKGTNPPLGPETEIDARNLKPDQLAERCVTLLRKYVDQLQ